MVYLRVRARTEKADEISVLVGGRTQPHYAAESGTLEADLPDALHRENLMFLNFLLLPVTAK